MPKVQDKIYTDISKVSIRPISKDVAKSMIENYHYTHKASSTRYALGIYYQEEDSGGFFEGVTEVLIGVLTYGYPVGRLAAESVSDMVAQNEVLELTRLYIKDGYGSNIESYCLSLSFKWLRENDKSVKVLISYADPQEGHSGLIYQATNWLYQGNSMQLVDSYHLRLESDGDWIHSRTVYAMYGSSNVDVLKSKINKTFWLKKEERKHRYLYILAPKMLKRKILSNLKHPILPYPTRLEIKDEEIIEITI